jgi:hypothetical protein
MSPELRALLIVNPLAQRMAYLAWLRRKLQLLQQSEAPMAERAPVRALLERLDSVHAMLSVLKRAPIVSN